MEVYGLKETDLLFNLPMRMHLCGPSGVGKSTYCFDLVKNRKRLFSGPSIEHIYWCVGELSSVPTTLKVEIPEVNIVRGLSFLKEVKKNSLCIFDDLVTKLYQTEEIVDLAIRRSGKEFISFIVLSQNVFYQSKYARTINLSMTVLVLFNQIRDSSTLMNLCRQINCREFKAVHTALTSHLNSAPYQSIIIDLHPITHSALRFRAIQFLNEKEAEERNCGDPIVHFVFLSPESVDSLCQSHERAS